MLSILLLLVAVCVFRFIYFLLFKNRDLVAATKYAFIKQIVFITFLLITFLFFYAKIAKYDTVVNSKKTCEKVIEYIENNNFQKIHKLFSKGLKNKLSNLLTEMQNQNNCLNFNCTNVSSNDKSGLILSDCNNNTGILEITFSGGWGFGWEISNLKIKTSYQAHQ